MITQVMGDREMINDSLTSQKHISGSYNNYANECVNNSMRNDFLNILREEHDIQTDLFKEMQSRGWYPVENADVTKVTQMKQKFQSMS